MGVFVRQDVFAGCDHVGELQRVLAADRRERRFRHDGNPALAWCLSNVVGHRDAKDNVFPRKELPEHKIDAAIALIMTFGQQIVRSAQESLPTIYQGDHTLLLW